MLKNLTIERTAGIVLILLLFAMALRIPVDTDTWWHIRSGDYTLHEGMIDGDPFSHTFEGEVWINHSWGSQIILWGVWQLAGNAGLTLYTAVLAAGGMLLLYPISAGNTYLRGFILILGAAAAAVFWTARPQMISFFLSAAVLFIVYSAKQGRTNWLWWLIPLLWLWSHLHAGWSIGYLFLLAFIVGEAFNNFFKLDGQILEWGRWRTLLLATLISIPLLVISPYGLDNLLVPFNTVNIDALRAFIQEWQSPNFQGRETWPFIAQIMLLFMALWLSRRSFDWSSFFLLIGTLFLALLYSRNIAVFAVATTPIITHHLDSALTERGWILRPRRTIPRTMAMLNAAIIALVVLAVGVYALSLTIPTAVDEAQRESLPVDAVAYLNAHNLPQPMFNSYNWGGYLMFAAPDYPVFIDGRTDLYGNFFDVYRRIALALGNWDNRLDEYAIRTVVVERGSPLDSALRDTDIWSLVYDDELAVVYTREDIP